MEEVRSGWDRGSTMMISQAGPDLYHCIQTEKSKAGSVITGIRLSGWAVHSAEGIEAVWSLFPVPGRNARPMSCQSIEREISSLLVGIRHGT